MAMKARGRRGAVSISIVQNVTGLAATQGSLEKPRNMPVQALDYIAGYLGALGAMVALARRVEQGGSWLVRVSLVQVAHWLASLGTVDATKGAAELPDGDLAASPHRKRWAVGPIAPPEARRPARHHARLLREARRATRRLAGAMVVTETGMTEDNVAGTDWSRTELDLIVADCFEMLKEERAGQSDPERQSIAAY